MTREEAVEILEEVKTLDDSMFAYSRVYNNALDMAIEALKAQEPRLLTLDEIHDSMVVWIEAGTKFLKIVDDDGVVLAIGGSERMGAKCFITVWDVSTAAMNDEYNVTWRAWSERPTKEQRENEPWDRRANDDQR